MVWTFSKWSRCCAVDKWHIYLSWLLRKFCLSPQGENGPSGDCLCFGTSCKMMHEIVHTQSQSKGHFAFYVMAHQNATLVDTEKQCFIGARRKVIVVSLSGTTLYTDCETYIRSILFRSGQIWCFRLHSLDLVLRYSISQQVIWKLYRIINQGTVKEM